MLTIISMRERLDRRGLSELRTSCHLVVGGAAGRMDKGAQSLARTRAWNGRQELLGSLEPEVKKAGWWCALLGLASLFPSWSGSTVTPPPPPGHSDWRVLLPLTTAASRALGSDPSSAILKCTSSSPSVKWAARAGVSLSRAVNSLKTSEERATGLVSFLTWKATRCPAPVFHKALHRVHQTHSRRHLHLPSRDRSSWLRWPSWLQGWKRGQGLGSAQMGASASVHSHPPLGAGPMVTTLTCRLLFCHFLWRIQNKGSDLWIRGLDVFRSQDFDCFAHAGEGRHMAAGTRSNSRHGATNSARGSCPPAPFHRAGLSLKRRPHSCHGNAFIRPSCLTGWQ